MTVQEAKELLLLHSFMHRDLEHPKMTGGFLGSLRPYTGLKEENFREVMDAINVLAEAHAEQPVIDKEIAAAVFGLCVDAWAWGISPNGMLPDNGLIEPWEQSLLEEWLYQINEAVSTKLFSSSAMPEREPS